MWNKRLSPAFLVSPPLMERAWRDPTPFDAGSPAFYFWTLGISVSRQYGRQQDEDVAMLCWISKRRSVHLDLNGEAGS